MSNVIVIRGPLGVGKSTVAQELAHQLNASYISIDRILEELDLDKVEGECIPLKNFLAANDHILPAIENNSNTIIDGNFYHKEQLDHLIENVPTCSVFTLKAPLDVCLDRDSKRESPYGKDATEAVHNLVSRFDFGTIIQTEDKSAADVVQEILQTFTQT